MSDPVKVNPLGDLVGKNAGRVMGGETFSGSEGFDTADQTTVHIPGLSAAEVNEQNRKYWDQKP